jgi:steroid delta-isomerase-like uncharacterized protein
MTATSFSLEQQVAALNRRDVDGFASFYAPDATVIDPQYSDPLKGTSAIRQDLTDFVRAFPDLSFTIQTQVGDGQTLAFEGLAKGTNRGVLATPNGEIPATNKPVTMRFAAFLRLASDGRIAEERRYYDLAGLFQQLGLER